MLCWGSASVFGSVLMLVFAQDFQHFSVHWGGFSLSSHGAEKVTVLPHIPTASSSRKLWVCGRHLTLSLHLCWGWGGFKRSCRALNILQRQDKQQVSRTPSKDLVRNPAPAAVPTPGWWPLVNHWLVYFLNKPAVDRAGNVQAQDDRVRSSQLDGDEIWPQILDDSTSLLALKNLSLSILTAHAFILGDHTPLLPLAQLLQSH